MGLVVTVRSLLESAIEQGMVDEGGAKELLKTLAGELGRNVSEN
jgi:hypothetical protein